MDIITRTVTNFIMNHIYASKYPYFEQYKIVKKPWPWDIDEKAYREKYNGIMINSIIGTVVVFPSLISFIIYFKLIQYETDPNLYPSNFDNFIQIMASMITFECIFYWGHRLFHTPLLYKRFHKRHHEYKTTVAISATYNHPVDLIATNLAPIFAVEIFLGKTHLVTSCM